MWNLQKIKTKFSIFEVNRVLMLERPVEGSRGDHFEGIILKDYIVLNHIKKACGGMLDKRHEKAYHNGNIRNQRSREPEIV